MDDKELYRQILGVVAPWKIKEIKLEIDNNQVDIYLEWPYLTDGTCPECGKTCKIHDRREERIWRHLDTCQLKTFIHCSTPRVKCSEHKTKTMEVPWAEDMSRFTKQFERIAIQFLEASENRKKTAMNLRLSWDEMNNIMAKAVRRGLERRTDDPIKYIGMDEKSFLKGQNYVTVMTDTEGKRILDIAQGRTGESVDTLWEGLTVNQKSGIEAVSMDFWKAFITGAEKHVPKAAIVHDRFHIEKYLNEAVDKVRRAEHKELRIQKDETLTGTKYLWLKSKKNFTKNNKSDFRKLNIDQLAVGRAWNRKELFRHFWSYKYEGSARKFFKKWYFSATHSRLKPVIDVAKMLKRHIGNILNYVKHKITNAFAEGINSKIQHIKATARGFRNFENYRTSILFYCGKLDLYP
jgi:transposase